MAQQEDKLPDLFAPDLRLVFVGTAAGHRSAAERAYYAHPGNRFWRTLHEVGLTPRCFKPQEFRDLLALGIGFTDMSKRGSGMDHTLTPDQFEVDRFNAAIRQFRPRAIAFTSKKAASLWYGVPTKRVEYGLQPSQPDFPAVFVLSSPSGAATSHWNIEPWQALSDWLNAA
ncbi:MAG: mismatch-specific DNA-glycosylase [Parvibaculum sp.]|nr:mismatch-specific DNA-glycosylase [Parvibaculum sp.]